VVDDVRTPLFVVREGGSRVSIGLDERDQRPILQVAIEDVAANSPVGPVVEGRIVKQ
jgi:hypothetical protein